MIELLIVNEFSSGSIYSYNGVDDRGRLYHLEPLPTKIKGWQNRELRQTILSRAVNPGLTDKGCETPGILPVYGPFPYQKQVLLGWEKREGVALWSFPYQRDEEARLFRDVLGLISAYQFYHQRGLNVGHPVWERILRGTQGIFFPDPGVVSGLGKPPCDLPKGLAGCHPPERFLGMPESQAGDLFYLGMIIYWLFTGELPYRLTRGWLTQAIVAGENIPIYCKRPDIHPAIAALIDSMFSVQPEKRPEIKVLHDKWLHFANAPDLRYAAPIELARQQRLTKALARQNKLHFIVNIWRVTLAFGKQKGVSAIMMLSAVIILSGFIIGSCFKKPAPSPLNTIRVFYQGLATPAAFFPDNDQIVRDYLQEHNRRFQAAREIVAKPLVQLSDLRIISGTPRAGVIRAAAEVVEWRWRGTGWQRLQRVEYLDLKKNGSGWKIISRK